jgi:hypothetical protein
MKINEALESVQFVVDRQGQLTAALLSIEAWSELITWVEDMTDAHIAAKALAQLEAAGGRPQQAGWLAWTDIQNEWNDEEESTTEATL